MGWRDEATPVENPTPVDQPRASENPVDWKFEATPAKDWREEAINVTPKKPAFDYYVKEPFQYLGQKAVEGYTGLTKAMDPERFLDVADYQHTGPRIYPDEPKAPKMFERDVPGVDYTLPPEDPFASYVMPPRGSALGRQPPPVYDPLLGASTGAQLSTVKGFGFPTEGAQKTYEEAGAQPEQNAVSVGIPTLASYGIDIGIANKALTKIAPTLASLASEGKLLPKAFQEGLTFGAASLRRATTEGKDVDEAIKDFARDFWIGAGFGGVSSALTRSKFVPESVPKSAFPLEPGPTDEIQKVAPQAFSPYEFGGSPKDVAAFAAEIQPTRNRGLSLPRPGEVTSDAEFTTYPKQAEGYKSVKLGPSNLPLEPREPGIYEIPKGTGAPPKLGPYKEPPAPFGAEKPASGIYEIPKQKGEVPKLGPYKGADKIYSIGPQIITDNEKGLVGWMKRSLTGESRTFDPKRGFDPSFGPVGKTENFIRKWFLPPGSDLPVEAGEARRKMMDQVAAGYDLGGEITGVFKGLDDTQGKLISQITKGEKLASDPEFISQLKSANVPDHAIKTATQFRTEANALQKTLFDQGQLGDAAYNKWLGTYRRRLIKEHYDAKTGFGKSGGVKRILKRKELSPEYLAEQEISNPGLPEYTQITQDTHRAALAKYIDTIKENPFHVLPDAEVMKVAGETRPPEIDVGGWKYKLMEGIPAEELAGKQRIVADIYGKRGLNGKYVLAPIADDLNTIFKGADDFGKNFGRWWDVWTRSRSLWKVGKAAANVSNTIGNATYNLFQMDMAMPKASPWTPSGWENIKNSWKDLQEQSPLFRQAQMSNTFGGRALREDVRELEKAFGADAPDNLTSLLEHMDRVSQKMGMHYGITERLSKMALFRYGMEVEGMTPEAASRFARKHIFDYQDVPRALRVARQIPLGPAFVTFPYKMAPRALEYAMDMSNPLRFWKYPTMAWAVQKEAQRRTGLSDEEIASARKSLPPWASRIQILVGKTDEGKPVFFDPRYIFPFMDIMGGGNEIPVLQTMAASGPEMALLDMWYNKSRYFGSDIIRPKDTTLLSKAERLGEYGFRALAPQAAIQLLNIFDAARGRKDTFGEQKRQLWKEIPATLSIRLSTPDERKDKLQLMYLSHDLRKTVASIGHDQSLSQEEKKERIAKAIEDFKEAK